MTTPEAALAQAIDTACGSVRTTSDPAERDRLAQALIQQLTDGTAELKRIRGENSRQLKEAGRTWREVGEILGGISAARAEQIAKGR